MVLTLGVIFLSIPSYFAIIPYIILGYDCLWECVKNIGKGRFFNEAFLMSIATLGAIILGEYFEACAVMFFYQAGELLGDITEDKCRDTIKESFSFLPEFARKITEEGFIKVSPDDLKVGDRVIVFAGEKIPSDGIVYEGGSYVDTASLTGESMPQYISSGSKVLGGSINLDAPISLRITKEYKNSSMAKVEKLLEEAGKNRAKSERFITAFAKRYTPAVVLISVLSAIILPFLPWFGVKDGIYTAFMFLVVSCPCALVISIPLTLFAGVGRASKNKILFKGNNALEMLYKIKNFAFDKTGTLTSGRFGIAKKHMSDEDFKILSHLERYSNHPLAAVAAREAKEPFLEASKICEMKGMGISALISGEQVIAGNEKLMEMYKIEGIAQVFGTVIHMARNGEYKGYVELSDEVRPESVSVIQKLKRKGKKVTILSGDKGESVKQVAEILGISDIYAELLPEDKVAHSMELKKEGQLCYIGDGINDAPLLATADIGISMGGVASDIAIKNSDIILLEDSLEGLTKAIDISKRTIRIVYQNIFISIGIKLLVMLLGFLKFSSMPLAVFADVGVMIIAVLNAARNMR